MLSAIRKMSCVLASAEASASAILSIDPEIAQLEIQLVFAEGVVSKSASYVAWTGRKAKRD
jgi:hypothetical protein